MSTYTDGDRCPACGDSPLIGDLPYRCLKCGWTSEPNLLGVVPPLAPHYIAAQHSIKPAIRPVSWFKAIEDRLRTAGYLGYGQQATLVRHWRKQYNVVADREHFAYLLFDATRIWVRDRAQQSDYDTLTAFIEATEDRSPDRPGDHAKNVVTAYTWLHDLDAPRQLSSQQATLGSLTSVTDWSEPDLGRCIAVDDGEQCGFSQINAHQDLCWTHCYRRRQDDYTLTSIDDSPTTTPS